ncbi:hypothetical protein GCM10010193_40080 [Kitasatospora atroaurantiaca]
MLGGLVNEYAAASISPSHGSHEKPISGLIGVLKRYRQGGPVLIDALFDDGDLDAAWEAAPGRAGTRKWLTSADQVRESRPAEAPEAYRRSIAPLKQVTGDGNSRRWHGSCCKSVPASGRWKRRRTSRTISRLFVPTRSASAIS